MVPGKKDEHGELENWFVVVSDAAVRVGHIRKSGEIRFSNMMFMNLSQYYNAQTTGYNRVPVACRIMVASSISYNQATILFLQCRTNIIWQRIYN